jgi:hypothetical protein
MENKTHGRKILKVIRTPHFLLAGILEADYVIRPLNLSKSRVGLGSFVYWA